ncbi:DUF6917 domain-containing protein [Streptomyces asiaticus]|uniref:DUF6917 domain-containing protein n=1 Tax=Streptomyces asiaticus TaxID=114695 RepID=UPI003F664134
MSEASQHKMFSARADIVGHWVAVMRHRRDDRAMELSPWKTRCIRPGEIHEIVLCRRDEVIRGAIDHVAYLGFAQAANGGVIAIGDDLVVSGKHIGEILGFDEKHMPNHYNILVTVDEPVTGEELGLSVGESIVVRTRN